MTSCDIAVMCFSVCLAVFHFVVVQLVVCVCVCMWVVACPHKIPPTLKNVWRATRAPAVCEREAPPHGLRTLIANILSIASCPIIYSLLINLQWWKLLLWLKLRSSRSAPRVLNATSTNSSGALADLLGESRRVLTPECEEDLREPFLNLPSAMVIVSKWLSSVASI